MEEFLKRHEAFVRELLASAGEGVDWADVVRFHRTRIRDLQQERLAHLLVTLFFGLCTLVAALVLARGPQLLWGLLLLLFLALLVPYVAHYYRLENGLHRWYELANQIERRAGSAARP